MYSRTVYYISYYVKAHLFILLYLLMLRCSFCFSENNYFNFNAKNYLLPGLGELTVFFEYNLENYSESDFTIKPVLENGALEIFDTKNGKWISSNTLWQELPFLSNEIKLRVLLYPDNFSMLYFKIRNKKTGELYETSGKKLWFESFYNNYKEELNRQLLQNRKDWEFDERQEHMEFLNKESAAGELAGSFKGVTTEDIPDITTSTTDFRATSTPMRKTYFLVSIGTFILTVFVAYFAGDGSGHMIELYDDNNP